MPDRASSEIDQPASGRSRRFPLAFGRAGPAAALVAAAGVVVLVIALLGLWLWYDRAETIAEGERGASNLARVLHEQTGRTFQAVDLTLTGIVDTLRLAPPLGEHDHEFEQALRRRKAALPYVRALYVIGPDGFITQDSDHPHTPRVSLADRGYFVAHAEDPNLELYVGPPLISRSVGTWFVSMSRRIERPDGSFGGIAVAAIEPRYFETFYEDLALGDAGVIALFNRDGILIARNPTREDAIGQSFAHFALFQKLNASRHGTYRTASSIDGAPRILSYRALEQYPLVVVVGLDERPLLAKWRQNTIGAGIVAVLIVGPIGGLAMVAIRQHRQRELARARLARVQKLEALGYLTGGIAHDFRNLLTAVSAGISRIRRHSDSEIRKTTDMITEAVESGNRLIAQLLAFARQQELAIRAEDANLMLLDLERLLRHAAGPQIRVELALAPTLWPCSTDRGRFDAAVLNLVVNAKDAMPAGGEIRIATANHHVEAEARPDTLRAGDYARVTVSDNGEGMVPEVLQRALDPFFTTKSDVGTGLGLSQIYGFVRQTGGDVQIESHVGAGTSVHLFFPRAAVNAAQPE